jgi:site-specific recombinase XerD
MATLKFYLKRPKDKNGELKKTPVPINLKFTINRDNRFELSTGEQIPATQWLPEKQQAKSSYKGSIELNLTLSRISTDIIQLWRDNKTLSLSELKEMASNVVKFGNPIQKKSHTLTAFVQDFIKRCEEGKIKRKPGTVQVYRSTLDHLLNFAEKKQIDLTFEAVDREFYESLLQYLWDDEGHEDNTVGKIIKTLKFFLREAWEADLHTNLSFKKKWFSVLSADVDEIYLNSDEILKIYNLDLSRNKALEESRDLFIFDCWVGVRYSDLAIIRPEHIQERYNGKLLRIVTTKTGEDVVIPFHQLADSIYQKYGRSLPKIASNPEFNAHLKEIARIAGLTEKVQRRSTIRGVKSFEWLAKWETVVAHTARRSFATNCYKMGIPTRSIMAVTGHKTEKSFLKYIRITKEEHAEIMLQHFNANPLMKIA